MEYLVNVDIGTRSSSRGSDRAACRHQAAVARICGLYSQHTPQSRCMFAVLAWGWEGGGGGDYIMDNNFHADLCTCMCNHNNNMNVSMCSYP